MRNVFPADWSPIRNNSFWALFIFQKNVIELTLRNIFCGTVETEKAAFKLEEPQIK